jgi:hypothetical protein
VHTFFYKIITSVIMKGIHASGSTRDNTSPDTIQQSKIFLNYLLQSVNLVSTAPTRHEIALHFPCIFFCTLPIKILPYNLPGILQTNTPTVFTIIYLSLLHLYKGTIMAHFHSFGTTVRFIHTLMSF